MNSPGITTLAKVESPWQTIEVRHHPKFGHPLFVDGDLQISESDRSYNVAMVSPLIMFGTFENVAILGGGDGSVLRELLDIDREQGRGLERAVMIYRDDLYRYGGDAARARIPAGAMPCCGTRPFDEDTGILRSEITSDIEAALENDFRDFVEQRVFIPSYGEAWTFLAARRK